MLSVPTAYANPEGATVVSGAATISQNGNKLDIHQTSNRALIDWRSFNIAEGEHTQFYQPSSSAVAVNRINDINPSVIAGKLSANGNIVLINPNGMMFTNSAVVDVNGILATTANIDTATFNAGALSFDKLGKADAKIINNGLITAADAGLVGLVAPQVENNGVIIANFGHVKLASADTAVLDFYGDDLLKVAVVDPALEKQLVKNTGQITAEGGTVALTAATARSVIDSLISVEGELLAPVVEEHAGKIIIKNDSTQGRIYANATMDASAAENGNGGDVILWADGRTDFYGNIKAEGGSQSGDGGFVEVSGKEFLNFRGSVSTLAANGEAGNLLLDPTDILITNAADQNISGASPFQPTVDDGPSVLDVATLETALAGGNVTVQTIATGTQDGDITVAAPVTWSANTSLSLTAHDEVYINAAITGRNALNITANDVFINAPITRSTASGFNVALQPRANNITMGVAGGAGQFNVSVAELDQIDIVNSTLTLGRSSSTADIDVGAYTWRSTNTTIRGRTGELQINGQQDTGTNNLRLSSRNLSVNADLVGSGTLTFDAGGSSSIGVAGAAGSLEVTTADLAHVVDGWSLIQFGSSGTQPMTVNAYSWNDNVRFYTTTGLLDIQGTQTALNGNNIELRTRNLSLNADLVGTGDLVVRPDGNITMGVAGGAGTLQVTNADLAHIIDGWNLVTFGTTGTADLQVGAYTWQDNVEFYSSTGLIDIQGQQNLGANNITITTRNLGLGADLVGTGTVTIQPDGNVTMGVAGGAGTLQVSNADIAHLTGGWSKFVFGRESSSQTLQVGAQTWGNDVEFRTSTGAIQIIGAQDFGANNLTLFTGGNPAISANVVGTGVLNITPSTAGRSIGLAGTSGSVALSAAELDFIDSGWSQLNFGRDDMTSGISSNAYTWRWPTLFETLTGVVRFIQAQDFQGFDVTVRSDGNFRVDNTLTGTGNFNLTPQTTGATIGLASGAGDVNLTVTELNRFVDGWNSITFGRTDSTADITVNTYTNWQDPYELRTGGNILLNGDQTTVDNGALTFAGAAVLDANRALTTAGGNIAFTGALNGSGFTLTADTGTGDLAFNALSNLQSLDVSGANLTFNGTATVADFILAEMTGTTTLNGTLTANGVGNPLVLSSVGFVNNAGSSALNAPNDRWLVYYNDPAGNTEGGLKPKFRKFDTPYATNLPASIADLGNGFVYVTDVIPAFLKPTKLPSTVSQVSQIPSLQVRPTLVPRARLGGDIFKMASPLRLQLENYQSQDRASQYNGELRIDPSLKRKFSL